MHSMHETYEKCLIVLQLQTIKQILLKMILSLAILRYVARQLICKGFLFDLNLKKSICGLFLQILTDKGYQLIAIFYFFPQNLNMKLIIFLFALFLLTHSELANLNSGKDCPKQYVPDITKICIRPNYIQGCETYKDADKCAGCSKDYELENGDCSNSNGGSSNSNGLIGCLVDNGKSCTNCANGFILAGGACKKGVRYCDQYDSKQNCARCENEYSLIFGECKHNLMLGCKLEQADHTCLECFKPFQLKNYQCAIPSCKSYNDYGCISCECGYFITETRSCQPMQTGCLKYYRGTCVECLSSYRLKGGACLIEGCLQLNNDLCTSCKKDYELLADGSCKFKNCEEWKDDSCLICSKGYNLESGKCVMSVGKYICSG